MSTTFLNISTNLQKYYNIFGLNDRISEWKSKGLSNERFKPPYIASKNISPKLIWMNNSRLRLEFEGSFLKQEDKAAFTPNKVVNLFIVKELDTWSKDLKAEFTLKNCLFGNFKITKNADLINILIQDMELDLILVLFFQFQILIGVKMSLFLEWIWAHLCIFIIKSNNVLFVNTTKIYQFKVKKLLNKKICIMLRKYFKRFYI